MIGQKLKPIHAVIILPLVYFGAPMRMRIAILKNNFFLCHQRCYQCIGQISVRKYQNCTVQGPVSQKFVRTIFAVRIRWACVKLKV